MTIFYNVFCGCDIINDRGDCGRHSTSKLKWTDHNLNREFSHLKMYIPTNSVFNQCKTYSM